MENNHKLKEKLERINNFYKMSEILHELSLMNIPDKEAIKIYELAKEMEKINY